MNKELLLAYQIPDIMLREVKIAINLRRTKGEADSELFS